MTPVRWSWAKSSSTIFFYRNPPANDAVMRHSAEDQRPRVEFDPIDGYSLDEANEFCEYLNSRSPVSIQGE